MRGSRPRRALQRAPESLSRGGGDTTIEVVSLRGGGGAAMAASSSRGDGDTNTPPVHAAVAATHRGVALRRDALNEVEISFSQPFRQNSAALKYFRMIGENPPGKPTVDR